MSPSIVVVVWRSAAWIRPWLFDGAVTAFVAVLATFEHRLPWSIKICGLLMALALIWRRHLPMTVLTVVYLLAPVHLFVDSSVRLFDAGVLIAMYSAVLYGRRLRWGVVAGAGAGVGVLVAATVSHHRSGNFWVVLWVTGAVTVATWVTAYGVRTRRLYVQTLEERTATLERERDHLALLAVAEERAAIAREIHDVVAHSLSVMVVQADAAGYTLDGAQKPARDALATIASTGREALEDMGRVVQLLRGTLPRALGPAQGTEADGAVPAQAPLDGAVAGSGQREPLSRELGAGKAAGRSEALSREPGAGKAAGRSEALSRELGAGKAAGQAPDRTVRPGRAALDGVLAERTRGGGDGTGRRRVGLKEIDGLVARSGLRVVRETVGTPGRLSAAQEITAYRIIQESLTNTLRHAGADAAVTLRLVFTSRDVRVEVSDDGGGGGPAAKAVTARPGHGLAGMRERVAIHGGDLVAGPRAAGGWQIVATIPRTSGGTA
ncbi:hypothetical protein DMB66_36030 [Actinoplanes sp. ATCC 53533]|uniref:sensor histidine kinase n=1 Tax=Actinoplanes sp. ATCC 53533 TaxID=1288362 RepID=UPI000F79F95A|nr:histidine kinase [Actinoplanes sp. ATCC 53533]RSM55707.1 hypothetical protein DMB66_36030 [Actinoplanes sp. ATCC 53533]